MIVPFYKNKIANKLLIYILMFSGLVTLIITAIQLRIEFQRDINSIDGQFLSIEQSFSKQIAEALWFFNEKALNLHLEGISNLKDIEFLELSGEGKVFISIGQNQSKYSVEKHLPIVYTSDNIQRDIGQLKIVASMSNVYSRLVSRLFIILISQSIKTFVVAIFIYVMFHYFVIRHLSTISNYLKSCDLGQKSNPLSLNRTHQESRDELDQVAASFNDASRKLKDSYGSLEKKIEERTAELISSNRKLKEQRDLFELVINSVPTRIFWKDLNLKYLGCNIHFAKDSGMETPEDVIGKDDFALVWKDDAKIYRADDKQVISTGKPKLNYEEAFLNKEGKKICWSTSKMPLKDEGGETIGLIATSENITERKNAENEKRRLEAQLQQSKKMESIGQLAGGIAHDFNNILSPIIAFTQLSQNELPGNHPVQENLIDILNGAKRARDLVQRILLFSRQKEYQLEPTDIRPIIKESYKLLRSSIPANIDFKLDLYSGEDFVLCDATEIHEIILNLCTNAYHAIVRDDGSIIIGLFRQHPPPELNLSPDDYLCLSVKDNGVGIPEDVKDKIFEPYVTTKEVGKGSGLGLSVVHGIVESCKGGISVKSSSQQGTEFRIYLPILKKGREKRAQDGQTLKRQGSERILFVDDEESITKLGVRALGSFGYIVTGINDSTDALNVFNSNPDHFDLVITDMAMPGMIGSELSKKMLEIRPDIQIIICSGYSEKLEKEKLKDLKVAAFLDKPLSVDALAKITRETLDKRKA